jgi:aspartate/glutamate racemase
MKAPHVCILQTSFAKRDDTIAFLQSRVPGVRVAFITDSTLLADVRANGGPTQAVIDRMILYAKAAEISGADLIVNSCSTVGEVADIYEKHVHIPVMKVDLPMAQEAARLGSRIALIATVETTLGPSQRLIQREGRALGRTITCDRFLQTEAWDALQRGDTAAHNRILLENIRALDAQGYDAIVMAQVSMRALLPQLQDVKTPLLCSFYSGYGAVADALCAIGARNRD